MAGWVGVVGGIMGSGIAEMSTRAGYEVLIREVDDEAAEAAQLRLGNSLGRAVRAGKFTEAEREAAQSRLSFTTELADLAGFSTCTSSPASVSTTYRASTYRASTSVSVGVPPRASSRAHDRSRQNLVQASSAEPPSPRRLAPTSRRRLSTANWRYKITSRHRPVIKVTRHRRVSAPGGSPRYFSSSGAQPRG